MEQWNGRRWGDRGEAHRVDSMGNGWEFSLSVRMGEWEDSYSCGSFTCELKGVTNVRLMELSGC